MNYTLVKITSDQIKIRTTDKEKSAYEYFLLLIRYTFVHSILNDMVKRTFQCLMIPKIKHIKMFDDTKN